MDTAFADPAVAWAASVLGGPVRATVLAAHDRATTWRVEGPGGSAVVKRVAGHDPADTAPFAPAEMYANELAGLEFLAGVPEAAPVVPRLLAADRERGLLLLEDLGDGPDLAAVLAGPDAAAAREWLVRWAETAGALAAATAGGLADWSRVRTAAGRPPPPPPWPEGPVPPWTDVPLLAPDLAAAWARAEPEAVAAEAALIHPDGWWVYGSGDLCPDNALLRAGAVRLVDHEWGRFHHAAMDAACVRLVFPGCWCTAALPADVAAAAEAAFRAALARGVPEAADDAAYGPALARAVAVWVGWQATSVARGRDVAGGPPVLAARLRVLAGLADRHGVLPALGEFAGLLAGRLGERGPEPFPAFRS